VSLPDVGTSSDISSKHGPEGFFPGRGFTEPGGPLILTRIQIWRRPAQPIRIPARRVESVERLPRPAAQVGPGSPAPEGFMGTAPGYSGSPVRFLIRQTASYQRA